ncbi:dephospho-CoA kinase [Condylostylus longicornis]|uniref:dephospho-CoA kinase n=1 Tax=Condylostylus longicornis TaxID=2530218 RepID=UPI00244DF31A|nr:dephospho-CoA kinase [Condylostylus longicornis]
MFLIAITGGIATGKSTVAKVFKDNKVPVIDADLIARQIVEPGKPAWHQIKKVFGDEVIQENGEINREILGKLIFNDKELRRKLNEITHPTIHRTIFLQVFHEFVRGTNYVVMDLPLLFETGILLDFIHKIICVTCDEETQIKRVMQRNNLSKEDAKKRISSQMSLDQKCEKSNFVIDNSGLISTTELETKNILNILNLSKHHWRIRFYFILGIGAIVFVILWLNSLFKFVPISYS